MNMSAELENLNEWSKFALSDKVHSSQLGMIKVFIFCLPSPSLSFCLSLFTKNKKIFYHNSLLQWNEPFAETYCNSQKRVFSFL